MNDDDPTIIALVLRWIYTGTHVETLEFEVSDAPNHNPAFDKALDECSGNVVLVHVKVYFAADKFLMQTLKKETLESIRTFLLAKVIPVESITHPDLLQTVYSETGGSELKRLFVFAIVCNIETQYLDERELEPLIKTMPELAWDLFCMKDFLEMTFHCDTCDTVFKLGSKRLDCYCGFQGLCSQDCQDKCLRDSRCPNCGYQDLAWEAGQSFWINGELCRV